MATQAVKDIYINYSADTKEFDAAQKAVNKELRSNEQLAKQLDKQFKQTFDTSDITPLIKEVQALEKAQGNAKMQAKKLAEELDKVDQEADGFDPVKYNQLAKDLSNAEMKAQQLNKQIIKTNKNIAAIETGKLDEMSQDFQKAAKSAGVMNDELQETASINLGEVVDEVSNLDLSFSGLLQSALALPGPLKAVGAGLVAVGAVAMASSQATARLNQMMIALEPACEAAGVSLDTATEATNELYIATGDLEGSIATVQGALAIYGDEIDTTVGALTASASAYQIQQEGLMDMSEATNIATVAQESFGVSAAGTYSVLRESSSLIAKYPGMVDDLGDSFKEFGDLMASMGYTIDEFFTYLNVGMELGAKNTDELVNTMNEFRLSVTGASEETVAAFDAIGLSFTEIHDMVANGQGQEAFNQTIVALNGVEDSTMQAVYAAALFGTMGEEFVAPMLDTQTEKLTQLSTTYQLNQQAVAQLTQLLSGDLVPDLTAATEALGMNQQAVNNMIYKYEQGGLAALNMTEKVAVLAAGMAVNGAAMGLSADQVQVMSDKLLVLTDSTAGMTEKLAVLDGEMLKFLFSGVLGTEQTAQLTAAIEAQRSKLEELQLRYADTTIAVGVFTETLWANYGATIEQQTGMDMAAWSALAYEEQIKVLSEAMGLNRQESRELENAFLSFQNAADGSETKTEAFKDMMTILTENGFQPNIEAIRTLLPLYGEMQAGLDGSLISTNNLTGAFAGMGGELDPTNGDLRTYIQRLQDSETWADRAKRAARDFADSLANVEDEASDAAREVDRLNDSLSTNASMPAPSGDSSSGKSIPIPEIQSYAIPQFDAPKSTKESSGSQTSVNNHMTFNISIENGDSAKEIADEVIDKINKKLGRLIS